MTLPHDTERDERDYARPGELSARALHDAAPMADHNGAYYTSNPPEHMSGKT